MKFQNFGHQLSTALIGIFSIIVDNLGDRKNSDERMIFNYLPTRKLN